MNKFLVKKEKKSNLELEKRYIPQKKAENM